MPPRVVEDKPKRRRPQEAITPNAENLTPTGERTRRVDYVMVRK